MTAAETIAKAIEKLEGLKADSTRGPWRAFETSGEHWHIDAPDPEEMIGSISANDGLNEARRWPNADLIVTLHRTIDAQLAILRTATEDIGSGDDEELNRALWGKELALAEAILGADQ